MDPPKKGMDGEILADSFHTLLAVAELKLPQFEIERVDVRGCKKFVLNFQAPPLGAVFVNKAYANLGLRSCQQIIV